MCWRLRAECFCRIKDSREDLDDSERNKLYTNISLIQFLKISARPMLISMKVGLKLSLTDQNKHIKENGNNEQFNHIYLLKLLFNTMMQAFLKQPALRDVDIVVKCKKYKQFQAELKQIEKIYCTDLNMAVYTNLEKVEEGKFFQIVQRDKLYVNFYGYKMSQLSEEQLNKVYLLWILKMDEEIRNNMKKRFSIIYYHSMATNTSPFLLIRDSFKKLPLQYYALLDRLYVVQSDFFLRNSGMFQFGRLYKLYSRRLSFIENLKQLSRVDQIKKSKLIEYIPQILKADRSELGDKIIEPEKNEQFSTKKVVMPKKQQKKDCLTIRLSQHKFNQNKLPIHLVTLVETIRKNPSMMELEGIFRKSGSIQEEEQIIAELSKMTEVGVLKQPETGPYCGYAVAGVIKKLFTKLSEPIIPYSVYNKIMALQNINEEDEIPLVKEIIYSLPETNRRAILYVLGFIKNEVLTYQCNKMNYYSMSVVFSPCFFRPEVSSLQDLLNSGRFASIVKIFLKSYQEIMEKQENKQQKGSQNQKEKQKRGSRNNGDGSLQPLNTNIY